MLSMPVLNPPAANLSTTVLYVFGVWSVGRLAEVCLRS